MNITRYSLRAGSRFGALLVFFSLLFTACNESPNAPVSKNDIYPLAVGNSWTYKRTWYEMDSTKTIDKIDTVTITIERDTAIGSERWFIVNDHFGYSPWGRPQLLQIRSGSLWEYDRDDDSARVRYKYPATIGEMYSRAGSATAKYTVHDIAAPVTVPVGSYACYKYEGETDLFQYLASNVGIVYVEFYFIPPSPGATRNLWFKYELISSTLN